MKELTFNEKNRVQELMAILDEIRYIKREQSVLDAIESETWKGINHIHNNHGKEDFFFPEAGYMEEKISLLEMSAERIRRLMFSKNR